MTKYHPLTNFIFRANTRQFLQTTLLSFRNTWGPFSYFQSRCFISYFPRHLPWTNAPVSGKTVTEIMLFVFHPLCLKGKFSCGRKFPLPSQFCVEEAAKDHFTTEGNTVRKCHILQKSAISQSREFFNFVVCQT